MIRASLCLSISRIQAWSPAYWEDFYVSNVCVCVEGSLKNRISASASSASWKPGPLLGSRVLGLANLQRGASIFQFLDGKVHLYC